MGLDLDDDRILGSLIEGKWKLVRRIGRGGMGQVFQVVHARMGIEKCVKILRPGAEEVLVKRFEREVRLAQQIRHPNVIRIDDFGVDTELDPEGVVFCVMEYIDGASLRDLIAAGALPVERACSLARQVALGVGAAHERDIIHRDIKPENVVVARGDAVTVLDFGIAKLRSPDTREDMLTLTRRGEIWATPQYMSPEQAMAATDLTPKSDIYSLGVVLFECLTGSLPFEADSARELIVAHVQKDVPSIRSRRPDLDFPEDLDRLLTSTLAKRPAGRPESMKALAGALEPFTRPRSPSAAPAGGKARRTVRAEERSAPSPPRIVVVPHPPAGTPASKPFPVLAHLFVHLGEELHDHVVGRNRVTLGRRTDLDVFVPDGRASKFHAEILGEGQRFVLEDRGSRNGTFVGRKRIDGRVTLGDVETLRIGNTYLLFCRGDARAADHFGFCPRGHPGERKAKFCGSCGIPR